MPRYAVTLPLTGSITVEVEADNESDAIEAALGSPSIRAENIDEWSVHRYAVRGNVYYGECSRAEATLLDDEGGE